MTATNVSLSNPFTRPTNSDGVSGGIYIGSGSPTAALVVAKGSLYIKQDASGTTDRLWIATDAAGTWTYFTSNA